MKGWNQMTASKTNRKFHEKDFINADKVIKATRKAAATSQRLPHNVRCDARLSDLWFTGRIHYVNDSCLPCKNGGWLIHWLQKKTQKYLKYSAAWLWSSPQQKASLAFPSSLLADSVEKTSASCSGFPPTFREWVLLPGGLGGGLQDGK